MILNFVFFLDAHPKVRLMSQVYYFHYHLPEMTTKIMMHLSVVVAAVVF